MIEVARPIASDPCIVSPPIMRHQCQHAVLKHQTQNGTVSESDKVRWSFILSCHVHAM